MSDTRTRQALLRARVRIEKEMDAIRSQIATAQARFYDTGERADRAWWASAHAALRSKGKRVQSVQDELGELRRAEAHRLEAEFVFVAKRRLRPELYDELMEEARYAAEEKSA